MAIAVVALAPPTPPPVYRIQRRCVVKRSPSAAEHAAVDRAGANLFGHAPTPFTLPTTHVWSLRVAEHGSPHVVLFHDADNARCMVRALGSFAKREKRLPDHYNDLRDVFKSHYRPLEVATRKAGGGGGDEELHVEACDLDEVAAWAAHRRIGVIAVAKITRAETADGPRAFQVPCTIVSPDPHAEVDQKGAFAEDFGWQMGGDDDPPTPRLP